MGQAAKRRREGGGEGGEQGSSGQPSVVSSSLPPPLVSSSLLQRAHHPRRVLLPAPHLTPPELLRDPASALLRHLRYRPTRVCGGVPGEGGGGSGRGGVLPFMGAVLLCMASLMLFMAALLVFMAAGLLRMAAVPPLMPAALTRAVGERWAGAEAALAGHAHQCARCHDHVRGRGGGAGTVLLRAT